jgi:hypothetical protein
MGASTQGGMKPQQPQQRPMGQQNPQGKGPGLPVPQQPSNVPSYAQPYLPVGANNGPFPQQPVQPVQQPFQPMQGGKGPGSPNINPQLLDQFKQMQMGNQNPNTLVQNSGAMQPGQQMPPNAKGSSQSNLPSYAQPYAQNLLQQSNIPSNVQGNNPMNMQSNVPSYAQPYVQNLLKNQLR